jgi:hypothetical protein
MSTALIYFELRSFEIDSGRRTEARVEVVRK